MKIKVNGKETVVEKAQLSVAELLKIAKVETPEMVSVQLNGQFLKKEDLGNTCLKDADEIDFLYFMGGGEYERAQICY